MRNKLNFIINGSEVKRFHAVRTLQEETNGHHSFLVAMLCNLLTPNSSKELLLAALVHDLPEYVTGDIPANVKYDLEISEKVKNLEDDFLSIVGLSADLTEQEERTLKLADMLAGHQFCNREVELGNSSETIKTIRARYRKYIEMMSPLSKDEELVVNYILYY